MKHISGLSIWARGVSVCPLASVPVGEALPHWGFLSLSVWAADA